MMCCTPAFVAGIAKFQGPETRRSNLVCKSSSPAATPVKIPGTPCFTPRITASPMTTEHRQVYLDAAVDATNAYIADFMSKKKSLFNVAEVKLLVPQLNPEFDIYDRRFLLSLAWAVVDSLVNRFQLRTRVLIQGTGSFGAVPLSVAGLRRNFEGDLRMSAEAWTPEGGSISDVLRTGDLENENDLTDDDEVIVVISPTNAVSVPVISDVESLIERAKQRPIIMLNPRLADVPSHSGVMQVVGRAERMQLLTTFEKVFVLRLLYQSATVYPVRGILHRAYPNNWEIWKSVDTEKGYRLIGSSFEEPRPDMITDAFTKDKYAQSRTTSTSSTDTAFSSIPLPLLIGAAILCIVIGIYVTAPQVLLQSPQ